MQIIHRPVDPAYTNIRAQRTLTSIVNGDDDVARWFGEQLKLLQIRTEDFLGRQGHYHLYDELYFVHEGEMTFDLLSRTTGKLQRVVVKPNEIVEIPAYLAHRAYAKAGTLIIALTGQPFREGADIPHDFAPLGDLPYGLVAS
ncbi:MAG: hypothetical protein M1275_01975 [Patescibacteria group bacterium]|nr:hypothetical protein [Patescibacteria group bacterium]